MSAAEPVATAEPPARGPQPAAGSAVLLRATLESLMLILLLRVVEVLFFGPGAFASLSLHPFWIVVLIASVQSGLFAGVITAGMATLLMEWPARPIGMDITEHYLAVAIVPMQWLLVSLCIGLFRQREIRAERRLAGENARLSDVNEALAAEVVRLDGVIREMEVNLVTAPEQPAVAAPSETLRLAAKLAQAAPDSMLQQFGETASALGAPGARLLVKDGERGFAGTAGAEIDGLAEPLPPRDPLVRRLASVNRAILIQRNGRSLALGAARRGKAEVCAIVAIVAEDAANPDATLIAADLLARSVQTALSAAAARRKDTADA